MKDGKTSKQKRIFFFLGSTGSSKFTKEYEKKKKMIRNKTSIEKFIDNIRDEQFKNIANTVGNDKLIFP